MPAAGTEGIHCDRPRQFLKETATSQERLSLFFGWGMRRRNSLEITSILKVQTDDQPVSRTGLCGRCLSMIRMGKYGRTPSEE